MTLQEFVAKKNLSKEQAEELQDHIDTLAEAMADYIIKQNFFTDEQHPTICQKQANKRQSAEQ